jgi:hypothetical protein
MNNDIFPKLNISSIHEIVMELMITQGNLENFGILLGWPGNLISPLGEREWGFLPGYQCRSGRRGRGRRIKVRELIQPLEVSISPSRVPEVFRS